MNRRVHELEHTVARGERHLTFLHFLSSRLAPGDQDTREDLMQEGLIALWLELRRHSAHYVPTAGRERRAIAHRMFRYARRERHRQAPRPITAHPSRPAMPSMTVHGSPHRRGAVDRALVAAAACVTLTVLAPLPFTSTAGALGAQLPTATPDGDAPPDPIALRIRLGAEERAYPIDFSARWLDGPFSLPADSVRAAIEGSVRLRGGARYAPVPTTAAPVDETRVRIRMSLRADGMTDSELTLVCTGEEAKQFPGRHLVVTMATTRARIRTSRDLEVLMTLELDGAATAECPARLPDQARMEAAVHLARLGEAARAQLSRKDTTARVGVTRQIHLGATSRDDSVVVEAARAGMAAVRLEASPDTVRLRVGERRSIDAALRVRALRADGSEIERFVPFYTSDAREVVRLGGGALIGVSPGIAQVTVRPLPSRGRPEAPVSTTVVVQVLP